MAETLPSNASSTIKQQMGDVAEFLVDAMIDNLILQGHQGTGKLMKSIVYVVHTFLDGLGFDVYMEHYGKFLDQGIEPNRVPFTIGSGAQSSQYIQGLIRFAKTLPFISTEQQAKSFAFAVAVTAKREGHPTVGSHKFSSTGRRKGFFTDAIDDNTAQIELLLESAMGETLQLTLDNIVTDIQKTIKL